jgi:hypothetical protein
VTQPGNKFLKDTWSWVWGYNRKVNFDGDGKTDIAVWRRDTGVWYILPSSTPGSYKAVYWGLSSDIPVPEDYDGDGKSDIAV